jgi:hypothetical protein
VPDLTVLTAALTSLKTATDIAKALRDNNIAVEKAELRLQLAEIIGALADAKIQLVELRETIDAKDAKIGELERAFEAKDSLIRYRDGYYRVDAAGEPTGVPYCLRCWDVDHRQSQLAQSPLTHRHVSCTVCKTTYDNMLVPPLTSESR